jgi:hypothetical protein
VVFERLSWWMVIVFNCVSVLVLFDVLTPHVLSEWMVEVCGKYLCGVLAFEGFELVSVVV